MNSIFPQFLTALSEWIDAGQLQAHRDLVRRLYLAGYEVSEAGEFLAVYVKQEAGK